MLNLSEITIPEYAKTGKEGGIVYGGGCLSYQFDGLDGAFYFGSYLIGDFLEIRPFAYRWDSSERHGRKDQSWLDVAFIDADKIVSVISFKKQSATNIFAAICEIEAAGIDLCSTTLRLKSDQAVVKVVDDGGCYEDQYWAAIVASVDIVTEAETSELKAFVDSKVFEWHLVGEIN